MDNYDYYRSYDYYNNSAAIDYVSPFSTCLAPNPFEFYTQQGSGYSPYFSADSTSNGTVQAEHGFAYNSGQMFNGFTHATTYHGELLVDEDSYNEGEDSTAKSQSKIPRPMNPFMVWAKEERKKLAKEYPTKHNSELSKMLGKLWKEMEISEKKVYEEKAIELKHEHQKKYPHYKYRPRRKPNQSRSKQTSYSFSKSPKQPKLPELKTSAFLSTDAVAQSNLNDQSNSRNSDSLPTTMTTEPYHGSMQEPNDESEQLKKDEESFRIPSIPTEMSSMQHMSTYVREKSTTSNASDGLSGVINKGSHKTSKKTGRKLTNFSRDTVSKILENKGELDSSIMGYSSLQSSSKDPWNRCPTNAPFSETSSNQMPNQELSKSLPVLEAPTTLPIDNYSEQTNNLTGELSSDSSHHSLFGNIGDVGTMTSESIAANNNSMATFFMDVNHSTNLFSANIMYNETPSQINSFDY